MLRALILFLAPSIAFAAPGIEGLLYLLVYIVVISLIFYAIWWFIGYVGIPEPFGKVVRVIVGLVALIIVIYLLLGMIGGPPSFSLR